MKIKKWILWIPIIGFIYSGRLIRKGVWFDKMFLDENAFLNWESYQIFSFLLISVFILKLFL